MKRIVFMGRVIRKIISWKIAVEYEMAVIEFWSFLNNAWRENMRKIWLLLFSILALVSLSCSDLSFLAPTPAPVPTSTSTQTATPVPSFTPSPSMTPKPPTSTPDIVSLLLPSGTPVEMWNGIPIMPGAIAGEATAEGYTFSIREDTEAIQAFYGRELTRQGYDLFATGEGDEKNILLLMFMQGTEFVTISIMPGGDLMIVLIIA
jgi:hypothetical protein